MSGHSKWATIKRKKALVDAKRSRLWTMALKKIQVAARIGGPDPDGNARLRLAMDKARAANVPKDAIKRSIDKGSGGGSGAELEEIVYEGYGPGGVAVVLECLSDNRNRTVGEIRHSFEKHGGTMGTTGSVSWMFKTRGVINVLEHDAAEEQLLELALEAGADDVSDEGEVWTVYTQLSAFTAVHEAIERAGISIANAEIDNVPDSRVAVDESKAESLLELIGILEDVDDVQAVYASYDMSDELIERYGS